MTILPSKEKLRRELILMAELYATTSLVIESPEAEITNSNISLFQYCIKQRHKQACSDMWPVNKWPVLELEGEDYMAFAQAFIDGVKEIGAHEILTLIRKLSINEPLLLDALVTYQEYELEKERIQFIEPTRNSISTEPKLTRNFLTAKEKLETQREYIYVMRETVARLLDENNPEDKGTLVKVNDSEPLTKPTSPLTDRPLRGLTIPELEVLQQQQKTALDKYTTEIQYQLMRKQHKSITELLGEDAKEITFKDLECSVFVELEDNEDHIHLVHGTNVITLNRKDMYKLKQLAIMAYVGQLYILTFIRKNVPPYSVGITRNKNRTVTIERY